MAYHHLALATQDIKATDCFYTRAMGFELVKVEIRTSPEGGWAKHFFYDTGNGEMMAFWELHPDDPPGDFPPQDIPTGLSKAVGLPLWVNHLAFDPGGREGLESSKKRWLETGYDVLEIDHDWCHSIYTQDPNGTLVEWCITTGEFDEADRERARAALTQDDLPRDEGKVSISNHRAEIRPLHRRLNEGA